MNYRFRFRENHQTTTGFTIVETIVTMVVVTLFITMFFQTYILLESQRLTLARDTAADGLAYTNLQKVTSRSVIVSANILCKTVAQGGPVLTESIGGADLFAQGTGYTKEPQTATDQVGKQLGTDVVQKFEAYPSSGTCAAGNSFGTGPIRIVSRVIYTTNGISKEVSHASYIY